MTHKASGAEGESTDGLEAFKLMISTSKYRLWHNQQMLKKRLGPVGLMHTYQHLIDRAESVIKLGLETGAIIVEQI